VLAGIDSDGLLRWWGIRQSDGLSINVDRRVKPCLTCWMALRQRV
jgi:hypothetical protein